MAHGGGNRRGTAPSGTVPVFITPFSHSPKTAIGVQTGHLMQAFPDRIHLYWSTPQLYRSTARSVRLENPFVARLGALQRPGPLSRLARALHIAWWHEGQLRPRHRRVLARVRARASALYLAPLEGADAVRMRWLVQQLDLPFVLHLWDSLSSPLGSDPDMRWLVQHADRVLALSEPLIEDANALGAQADALLFTRPPAEAHAVTPPDRDRPVRVALLGLLDPYLDGVLALERAADRLAERGIRVEPVFIGAQKAVDRINGRLARPLTATGFLPDAERDARLASCQFGFVPGPSADPETDMRSRYSIPSRTLDLLAAGLPLLGAVHARSATGRFLQRLGFGDAVFCSGDAELATVIEQRVSLIDWEAERARSEAAFASLQTDAPPQRLRAAMEGIARSRP